MITTINEFRKQFNESKKDNLPKKGSADWHQLQVAKKTIKMVPTMAAMMGGMTYDKAKEILAKYGINEDLGLNNQTDMTNQLNPLNNPANLPPPTEDIASDFGETKRIADYAASLGLSKEATKNLIHTVFADPSQAPDEISVAFVQDHMGEIITAIDSMPETNFPKDEYTFTDDMTTNILPFECVMYAKDSNKLKQLTFSLNEKIKRNGFKAIYENNIFFINSLDGMSNDNKNVITKILESEKAINIANNIKWKRKIK